MLQRADACAHTFAHRTAGPVARAHYARYHHYLTKTPHHPTYARGLGLATDVDGGGRYLVRASPVRG